jgi:hypothetical protein
MMRKVCCYRSWVKASCSMRDWNQETFLNIASQWYTSAPSENLRTERERWYWPQPFCDGAPMSEHARLCQRKSSARCTAVRCERLQYPFFLLVAHEGPVELHSLEWNYKPNLGQKEKRQCGASCGHASTEGNHAGSFERIPGLRIHNYFMYV